LNVTSSLPPLVDAHGHLQAERFTGDRTAVIERARAANMARLLIPSWDRESAASGREIAAQLPWADAAIGIHPHVASIAPAERDALLSTADDPLIVAIGEAGIDTDRNRSPLADQITNLEAHIAVACALGKPLIIHCRSVIGADDAQRQLLATLRASEIGQPGGAKAFAGRPAFVLHSASGPASYVEGALALGGAVSISGLAFRASEAATRDWVRIVPVDRLLTETDAPWLVMPGAPDQERNEPANVAYTLRWVAEQRGEEIAELAPRLVANYDRIFPRSAPRG